MARKYPDILRVGHNGMKRKFGARHNSCPNSPTYRKYSVALAAKLAERYKDYAISLHGIFPMNMAGNVTAKTVKKHSVYGCIKNMERWMS